MVQANEVPLQARVGVGVLVIRSDGQLLVGKRKSALGQGDYALPGGHLEYGEGFEECALRELLEETGIEAGPAAARFAHAVNTVFPSGAHYVTIFIRVDVHQATEAVTREPEKCEGWEWVEYESIPQPRFLPLQKLLESDYSPAPPM